MIVGELGVVVVSVNTIIVVLVIDVTADRGVFVADASVRCR